MEDQALDDLKALLPPVLRSLEALGFVARHLYPLDLPRVVAAVGEPEADVRAARPRLEAWPEALSVVRGQLESVCDHTLTAFEGLRAAADGADFDLRGVFRALGQVPRAQEALYPLASAVPPVSRYFLSPDARDDSALAASLAQAPDRPNTGVFHVRNEPGSRGGYSLYVPEYYSADRAWPLVTALHGGAGNGRSFLWTWLRDARSHGAILVAPTAVGETWGLNEPADDASNLERILDEVRGDWSIDPTRLLLAGMSDGGTFAYVSGLQEGSPFTHLAPASAAFNPMLMAMADPERLRSLPIHIAHGARDWMFPVEFARQAEQALSAAGARVTYREIADLSHCYPRELNPQILTWMDETA